MEIGELLTRTKGGLVEVELPERFVVEMFVECAEAFAKQLLAAVAEIRKPETEP